MTVDATAFLERAVQTPSHEDVAAMRSLLVEALADHGHAADVDDAGNVVATRGSGDPHLVLNTHLDTVPPHVPFERDGAVIRGRGACDAKGPLAALLAAFVDADVGSGRLTLAVTPDEETDSTGAAALDLDADGYVVGEPTGLDVCNAARGRFEATVDLAGESAHAADPRDGENAVDALSGVLDALHSYDDRSAAPPVHPDLGPPTLTPTTVRGGEAGNQVPASCSLVVDRRTVPPETAEAFREGLAAHLRQHVPAPVEVSVSLADREAPFLAAWETPADDPLVEVLAAESGGTVRPFGAATEASLFAREAPTVVFGPGHLADEVGPVAHADREYVRVAAVESAAAAATRAVESLLGGDDA